MKSLAFCLIGLISGIILSSFSVYLFELRSHIEFKEAKEEKKSALYALHNSGYWEPVHASTFGAGRGNSWALMLVDGAWRTLVISSYTPWDLGGKKAYVHISSRYPAESGSSPDVLIEINSAEEKKLIETLESLHYQEHQRVFEPVVTEFIETLSDRSKFVYEPKEMEIEPTAGGNG